MDGRDTADRFAFGRNWRRFLEVIDERRVAEAQRALSSMLGLDRLDGRSFLDIGSGSGLMSLAARRLGATVRSFDYDPDSVACTAELRRRMVGDDPLWTVERGSILDEGFVRGLGQHDVVYAWGVLHHTGDMARALRHAALPVKPGGLLFIAIYNDQGAESHRWKKTKRRYQRLPAPLRPAYVAAVMLPEELRSAIDALRERGLGACLDRWRTNERGMSRWHDMVDWVGGWPFEVAEPGQLFQLYRGLGFSLVNLVTRSAGYGCNELVLRRDAPGGAP